MTFYSSDASQVSFLQAGTGAVVRSSLSKLHDFVSVMDFGAVGDNTNDDTAAIQAAVNAVLAAGGGTVYVPPGSYKVTATITLGASVSIVGLGKLATKFYPTTAVTGRLFSYKPAVFTTSGIVLSDFAVYGNATTLGVADLQNLTFVTIQRVYMDSFTNSGQIHVSLNNVEDSTIAESAFMSIHGDGLVMQTNANNNVIRGCTFNAAGAAGVGISMDSTTQNTVVIGCNFEGASVGNTGIIAGGSYNTCIIGNYFEYWTGACVSANTGTTKNLRISDNFLLATSAAAACCVLNSAGVNDRLTLENNYLEGLGNAGITTVGFFLDGSTNVWARGNKSGGAGTGIIHIGGSTKASPDYCQVSSIIPNVQSPAYAATLNIDASTGDKFFVGALTGNITIAAPTNGTIGQRISLFFIQDTTAGHTVTWNSVFIRVSWSDAGNTAFTRSSISFTCLDGTNWIQEGAAKGWS